MTTNKPGTVTQQPLYGCTSCYEDYSWRASDLRVHDGECWCELCWDEKRWEFPDQPYWSDLEPYTPEEQQPDATQLVEALENIIQWVERWASEDHPVATTARKALDKYRKGDEA